MALGIDCAAGLATIREGLTHELEKPRVCSHEEGNKSTDERQVARIGERDERRVVL